MAWFTDRLKERSSQAALAALIGSAASVASQTAAWQPGSLPLWLGLVPVFATFLVAFIAPDAGVSTFPEPKKGD
jgi:hypothetical protein